MDLPIQSATPDSLFKWLSEARTPVWGGLGQWPVEGEWASPQPIHPCVSGYHLCTLPNVLEWERGALWLAEGWGEHACFADKVVYREARLIRKLPFGNHERRAFAASIAPDLLDLVAPASRQTSHTYPIREIARGLLSNVESLGRGESLSDQAAFPAQHRALDDRINQAFHDAGISATGYVASEQLAWLSHLRAAMYYLMGWNPLDNPRELYYFLSLLVGHRQPLSAYPIIQDRLLEWFNAPLD